MIFNKTKTPTFSFLVLCYDMAQEVKNTLRTLETEYQNQPIESYEVLIAENPSSNNLSDYDFSIHKADIKYLPNKKNIPLSEALNKLVKHARGEYLIVIPDGARLLSPRILHYCIQATKIDKKCIVAFHGFHLGLFPQQISVKQKLYSKQEELDFLESVNFPNNPDALFFNACWAGSSKTGIFFQMAESNCLMLPRKLWQKIGGYDERLNLPSGGLANLDLYNRVIEHQDHKLFFVLGEGSFHQLHGGDTTNSDENKFEKYKQDYLEKTGKKWQLPSRDDYEYLGRVPPQFLRLVKESISKTIHVRQRERPSRIQSKLNSAMSLNDPQVQPDTSFIFIHAMHRSKSSYISKKILHATNAIIPGTTLGGNAKSNPEGHYEPWELVVFHNNIMNEMGHSWRSISNITFQDEKVVQWRVSQLEKLIAWSTRNEEIHQTDNVTSLLIKDPRLSRVWPIWDKYLTKHRADYKKLVLIDHPHKIATSLNKRDKMNMEWAKLLWARYTLNSLEYLSPQDTVMNLYSMSGNEIAKSLGDLTGQLLDVSDYIESKTLEENGDIDRIFLDYSQSGNIEQFMEELQNELSFVNKNSSLFEDIDFFYANQFS